ncbi:hypothetical protein [Hydrogenophaga sp.]|uniref:hypothetical protein n=1 Tax=Hydrogenophaga sp. TaxID=1904254 RepID=UPI0026232A5E|nr:hypothetical protein [Hydrogenophaga sp.]MDM7950724.1 hypothetical protein [Hydrogenophaga sp.]
MKNTSTLQCLGITACLTLGSAHAQPSVSVASGIERIENPSLASVSPGGTTVLRIAPDYTLETLGDRYRSRLSLGAVLERSSNTALVPSRNFPSLGYTWAYGWPTAGVELRTNLAESATRNSQLLDLGRITVDSRERSVVAGARWNQELTERTRLTMDVASTRVSYDSILLQGYRELVVSSQLSWEATDRMAYFLEPTYRRLTPLSAGEESTQIRWLAGTRGDLSPEWSLAAFAGQARTKGSQTATGTLSGLQLTYAGSRLSSGVEWSRDVAATGTASGYIRTEALGLRLAYQVAEGATLSATVTNSRSEGVAGGRGRVSGLSLDNVLGARWSSTLGIEDRWSRGSSGSSARGWSVRAGLIYAYPGR